MRPSAAKEWLQRYVAAWESADAGAVADLFAEDAVYRSHIFKSPNRGRRGVREYWSSATSTQRDVNVLLGDAIVDEDRVAVEWWATMFDSDEGHDITLPGVLLLRFRDGLCDDLREYWHVASERREPYPQWGTIAAGDRDTTRRWAQAWAAGYERAWRALDAEAAARLYSPGARSRTAPFREPSSGREGVLEYTKGAYASESDTRPRLGNPFVMDGGAAVEWWANYVEDGVPKTLAGCSVLSFDDSGLVATAREYWHESPGTRGPPESWGL